jgi:hypothetical protein
MPKLRIDNLPFEYKTGDVRNLLRHWKIGDIKDDSTSKNTSFIVEVIEKSDIKKIREKLENEKLGKKKLNPRLSEIKEAAPKSIPHNNASAFQKSSARVGSFPYRFVARKRPERKEPLCPPRHDQLIGERFDMALQIVWETATPVAANPCEEPGVPGSMPQANGQGYGGYNLRWLMIDGCLAISPFTVKSAIANGFSNLMGSCYRVITKKTGPKSDTVPEGQAQCCSMKHLCPRCALFGMTVSEEKGNEDVGYRGRFKSATLVCDRKTVELLGTTQVPGQGKNQSISIKIWTAVDGTTISEQVFMPIQLSPKANKLDVDGYFDQKGNLKGAKSYRHAGERTADLTKLKQYIKDAVGGTNYKHRLRNYAQVCAAGLEFKGTVGVENTNAEEAAALILLLEHSLKDHGFKIGLGKALGLGSVRSRIERIWVRRAGDYRWTGIDLHRSKEQPASALESIKGNLPDIGNAVGDLMKVAAVAQQLNTMKGMDKVSLEYPSNLKDYWKIARRRGLNE